MSNESRLQLAAGTIAWKSALEDTDQQTIARVLDLFHIPVGSRRKNIWGDSRKVKTIILQLFLHYSLCSCYPRWREQLIGTTCELLRIYCP